MQPRSVMIKPASSACNLRCRYCFYTDETTLRNVPNYGIMSDAAIETVIKRFLAVSAESCSFTFQGGEPTLVGLDFFRYVLELEKKYNVNHVAVHNAIQTNGTVIDEEWANFLSKNHFLVGLSLDGNKYTHDCNRVNSNGEGSYKNVLRAAQLFDRHHVEYNILTVVTSGLAKNIGKVFSFYKKNGFRYQQYIPCIDALYQERGCEEYSLTPKSYETFLKKLFDLWCLELKQGNYISIRYFDNLVYMRMGHRPELCSMCGYCNIQYLVESDGSVFPCDFYAMDEYLLGNVFNDDIDQIDQKRSEIGFIQQSMVYPDACKACKWFALCRNGCRRDRLLNGSDLDLNYYCSAYQGFFEYAMPQIMHINHLISQIGK